jgi:hypothetical protein
MTKPHLIALVGLAGSGKSTAAKYLTANHGYRVEKFAGPLKDMLRAFGLTEAHIEGDLKEAPCDLLGGRTPRYAMQTLGTEWGRDLIHPSLWTGAWMARARGGLVVTDDCRFENEAEAVRRLGGMIIRVARPSLGNVVHHASESGQSRIQSDRYIVNGGTPADLFAQIDAVLLG